MATHYCKTNETRTAVVIAPIAKEAIQIPGVANPSLLTDPQLLDYYWYPYVLVDPGLPSPHGEYYAQSLSGYVIQATQVEQTASYTQWDIEEVRAVKNSELESQLTQYSANEVATSPKFGEYVENDFKWLADKQAELARLTDWNAVANFDTQKPAVVQLPNNFVAESYVGQGLRLTAENQAAAGAGQAEIWDQTLVNNFVSANQTAAADSSGSQPPTQPTYQFRQPIATPSEQFARVVIWREARDDPNPALRTTYKMRLLNRQDDRNLYIFSYTNGTYLTWRQFLPIAGNNDWGLEATPSEWEFVPLDMKFRFSYGTNPAVEADLFTDDVLFPAGVEQRNIFVAWDPV